MSPRRNERNVIVGINCGADNIIAPHGGRCGKRDRLRSVGYAKLISLSVIIDRPFRNDGDERLCGISVGRGNIIDGNGDGSCDRVYITVHDVKLIIGCDKSVFLYVNAVRSEVKSRFVFAGHRKRSGKFARIAKVLLGLAVDKTGNGISKRIRLVTVINLL